MTAAGGVSYGYDANGNQASRGSDTFAWDFEDGDGGGHTHDGRDH